MRLAALQQSGALHPRRSIGHNFRAAPRAEAVGRRAGRSVVNSEIVTRAMLRCSIRSNVMLYSTPTPGITARIRQSEGVESFAEFRIASDALIRDLS
jgi:hypothetical protein